jgi:hypothetical protein
LAKSSWNKFHLKYFLGDDGRFQCRVCGKSYKHYPSLWRHLKRECGNNFKFACDFCGIKFMQEKALSKHVENKHPT